MSQNPSKMLLLGLPAMKKISLVIFSSLLVFSVRAEDGYRLWLRYEKITDAQILQQYTTAISSVQCVGNSPSLYAAKDELIIGLEGLLGKKIESVASNESVLIVKAPICAAPFDDYPSRHGKTR